MEKIHFLEVKLALVVIFIFLIFNPTLSLSQENFKLNIPFSKIAPLSTTTLKGVGNHINVKIPIPERWKINRAILNFSYVNSTALLQSRSRLVVWLNQQPVAQITLNPQLPQGKVSVNLPVNLLKSGYNDLIFTVAHHYSLECEDPSSPELWTTIEFDRASFDFDIALKRLPENVSAIANFLFDSKMFGENEVNIIIPDKREETIELASIVASAVAWRFEFRNVKFSLSENIKKGVDNIILGNSEFIKAISDELINEKGSIIKIKTLKDDYYHALIILKGDTYEELKRAVYAFSSINFPFPQSQFLRLDNVSITPQIPPSGKGFLLPGYEYSFKDLGFFTTNFKGIGSKSQSMDFKIPSHIFFKPNSFISLKLNFSYGSGMKKDSALNIQINGKYVASIHLDNVKGGIIRNYLIDIPLTLFNPGFNQITFTAVLSPITGGYCEFIQTENLQLTIFEDSKILIPDVPSWTEMPNLSLFFIDGFPFSKPADFSNAAVLITDSDIETLSSAVNLIALSSQRAGYIPFKIKVSFDKEKVKDRNIIVIGKFSNIPDEYFKTTGIASRSSGSFVYYLVKYFDLNQSDFNVRLRTLIEKFLPIFKSKSTALHSKFEVKFSGKAQGRWIAIFQSESPHKSRNTIMIITSTEAEYLYDGIYALWEPSISAKVGGALTIFDPKFSEDTISSYSPQKYYYLGKMGFFSSLYAWIYANPLIFSFIMLIIMFLFAYFILRALKRFKRKRLKGSDK